MELSPLKYESKLTIKELGSYLSEFQRIFSTPIDEPTTDDNGLLMNDIYLGNKSQKFDEALKLYLQSINRVKKMSQTASMKTAADLRKAQISGHFSCITSFMTDTDKAKVDAAAWLMPIVDEFRGFYKLTASAQSTHIRKYIETLRSEKYAEAFGTLGLEERTNKLEATNEEYIRLASERAEEAKNMPDSPSETRRRCIREYRKLVELINFALEINQYYIYDETAIKLIGITATAQELINRRKNGELSEEEHETGKDSGTDNENAETVI